MALKRLFSCCGSIVVVPRRYSLICFSNFSATFTDNYGFSTYSVLSCFAPVKKKFMSYSDSDVNLNLNFGALSACLNTDRSALWLILLFPLHSSYFSVCSTFCSAYRYSVVTKLVLSEFRDMIFSRLKKFPVCSCTRLLSCRIMRLRVAAQ